MDNQSTDNSTSQVNDFVGMLSTELQNHPSASKFKGKSASDVFQSYTNLESLINKKQEGLIRIPGENASNDEKKTFYRSLGVPDKPEDYSAPDFEDLYESLPGGKNWKPHQGMDTWFRKQAHELGLTPKQFEKLYKNQIAFTISEQKNINENMKQYTKKIFGDKYDDAIKTANRALDKMTKDQQDQLKNDVGIDPKITMILSTFGKNLGESQSPDGSGSSMASGQTLIELKKRRDEIRNTKEYRNGNAKTPEVIEVNKITQKIVALERK